MSYLLKDIICRVMLCIKTKKVFVLFFLIVPFMLFSQTKSPEIQKLEKKVEELKSELKTYELKLKTLRVVNQNGYTNTSINYSDKYIKSILTYMGPIEFQKMNNSWSVVGIDTYTDSVYRIPIEDVYGLENFSDFWDIKKNRKYYTKEQPYLSKCVCKNNDKTGVNNVSLEILTKKGLVSAYVYNCSDKILNSFKIEVSISKFSSSEILSKTIVELLKNESVKPGEYKKIEVVFDHNANATGFFYEYSYKVVNDK